MRITTERLTLRYAEPGDLAALHAILSDPRAMRYWSSLPHTDLAQTEAWLAKVMANTEGEDFVVEHEGRVIGKTGLYRFPDVGFIFRPHVWGRGFAREALTAVLARAFAVHGLERITADVDPRNDASLNLLKRLGFVETSRAARTWLIGEEWCDSIYLALERPLTPG